MRVPFHPRKEELTGQPSAVGLAEVYAQASDFKRQTLVLKDGSRVELCWLDGMVRAQRLSEDVVRPLSQWEPGRSPVREALQGAVWVADIQQAETLRAAAVALTDGSVAMEIGGSVLLVPVPTEDKRSVNAPEDEPAVKGGNDAFVEALNTNLSLVRRRIHSWTLGVKTLKVGRESRTGVSVVWMEGITNPELVARVERKLGQMDVDALLGTQAVCAELTNTYRTMLPMSVITQRPDRFCQGLMDGMVGVFCDGLAQGILLPGTSAMFLRAPQDPNAQWLSVRGLVAVRYLSVLFSLLFPAGYIAMASFHFGLMPAALAESISASRQSVPISPPLEVLLLLVAFEILQEAGLRMPSLTSQSVSIIGSLVVGQAAVEAKLLSPVVVVVVAAAGIAGYTLPNLDLANALRGMRFALAVLAALFGTLGIVLGLVALCCHLSRLEPLGVPWLAPFAPDQPSGPNAATRVPVRRTKLRELFLHPGNLRNQK